MFKKLLVVSLVACMALFAGNAFAGDDDFGSDSTWTQTGNQYSGTFSNNTSDGNFRGFGLAAGGTETKGFAASSGDVVNEGFAASGGIGVVHSESKFGALGLGGGEYDLYVSGGAYGGSEATAFKGNGQKSTRATGWSYGEGSFKAGESGKGFLLYGGELNGYAGGVSGTVAFADRGRNNTTAYSIAGAATGSVSGAYTDAPGGKRCWGPSGWSNTNASGAGSVSHQTYAETFGGSWAGTNGNASYAYNNNGGNSVIGGGFAATGGFSTVTQTETTVSSHSKSFGIAVSTGGHIAPVQQVSVNN